jgi:hypothetical protein
MYLRTTRRKNRDGSEVVYYQLAHNVRHPDSGQTVAQVIHTFGRADEMDREALVRLCRSIARVCGLKVEDPLGKPPEGAKGGRDRVLTTSNRKPPLRNVFGHTIHWPAASDPGQSDTDQTD